MMYVVVCPECGNKETFYTLNEPKEDFFCPNCGSIVKIPIP